MIRFRQFLKEAAENSLQKSIIKEANVELFNLVKEAGEFDSTSDILKSIVSKLEDFDLAILESDNTKFAGRLIDSKGSQTFKVGSISSMDDRKEMTPYKNVSLTVSWNETNDKFTLKDCFLK